jgi:hypothetical protein
MRVEAGNLKRPKVTTVTNWDFVSERPFKTFQEMMLTREFMYEFVTPFYLRTGGSTHYTVNCLDSSTKLY